jgi:hypothetical protein
VNDLGKIGRDGRRKSAPRLGRERPLTVPGPAGKDMAWVDRLEALDDDAAAAALERPKPDRGAPK